MCGHRITLNQFRFGVFSMQACNVTHDDENGDEAADCLSCFTFNHFPTFQRCKSSFYFYLEGKGPTAVIKFVKQREEIRKSVGDLLNTLALRLERRKKLKCLFSDFFFFLCCLSSL